MRVNAGSQVWGEKKTQKLVSVLPNLQDGAFSVTTKLSNSSPPSCLLQNQTFAQKWPACSHFQGNTFTLRVSAWLKTELLN